jgi:hypothetical protein
VAKAADGCVEEQEQQHTYAFSCGSITKPVLREFLLRPDPNGKPKLSLRKLP